MSLHRRASAARSAAGRLAERTTGFARADTGGTHSTLEGSAQPAFTNGQKRNVSRAVVGRRTRSGMRLREKEETVK